MRTLGLISFLLGLFGACRPPFTPILDGDMSFELPTMAWFEGSALPRGVAQEGMPLVADGTALIGYGGEPLGSVHAWSYTLANDEWQQMALAPSGREGLCATALAAPSSILYVGGQTAAGPATPVSTLLDLTTSAFASVMSDRPTPGDGCAAAYMQKLGGAVVYGGDSTPDETWLYDPVKSSYTQLTPDSTPGGLSGGTMVEDPGETTDAGVEDFLLYYGGLAGGVESDVLWLFNGTSWDELATSSDANAEDTDEPRPQGRTQAAVALDPTRRILYVFGGLREGVYLADLWRLDLRDTTWQRMSVSGGPEGRAGAAVAYDATGDRLLMFGGRGDAGLFDESWALKVVIP